MCSLILQKTQIFFVLIFIFPYHTIYSQCVSGDCQNGFGRYEYKKNVWYEGDFTNGIFNGKGTYLYGTGTYWGEYLNGKRHGKGIEHSDYGWSYEGEFSDDKINGNGIYHYPNGDIVEGNFVNGKFISGSVKYSSGDKYFGSITNGNREGMGTYIWSDGDKYVGPFLQGNFHGEGIKVLVNGDVIEGVWSNGKIIEQKKKEPSPQNNNLSHLNNVNNYSKSSDLLASVDFEFPVELLERKISVDRAYAELKALMKTNDSIKEALDIYKPGLTKELDVETYKTIINTNNVFYILRKNSSEPYNDKINKLNQIETNSNYWIDNSFIIFHDVSKKFKESSIFVNNVKKFTSNTLYRNKYDKSRFKIISSIIKKYGPIVLLKNEDRTALAKRLTGIDQHYFDLIDKQQKTEVKLKQYLNNYKIDLNGYYFYFGEKSNNFGNGFGYLCSKVLTNNPIVLEAKWENGYPIKLIEINLYKGMHTTAEIPSLDIKKTNSNNRILVDYNGLIMGELLGKDFEGNILRVWKDGNYFIGTYKNGKRTEGYAVFVDGGNYFGRFDEQGSFKGIGKYKWKDGSMYQGEWVNNERNGYGTYTNKRGDIEEGLWQKDVLIKSKETLERENREAEQQRITQEKLKQEEERKQREAQEKYSAYFTALFLQGIKEGLSNPDNTNSYNSSSYGNNSNLKQNQNGNCYSCSGTGKCKQCNKEFKNHYWDAKSKGYRRDNVINLGNIMCTECKGMGEIFQSTTDNNNEPITKPCHVSSCKNGWKYCSSCNPNGQGNSLGNCKTCKGSGVSK